MSAFDGKDDRFDSWCKMENKKRNDEYIKSLENKIELLNDKYNDQDGVLSFRNDVISLRESEIKILKEEKKELMEFINNQAGEYEDSLAIKFLRKNKKYIIQES